MKTVRKGLQYTIILVATTLLSSHAQRLVQRFESVGFAQVTIMDGFWKTKLDKPPTATLRACIVQTEEKTGHIRNFEKVARSQHEKHEGIYYDDSDVYKAIEAMAYSLKNHPDAAIEQKADEWIGKIGAAPFTTKPHQIVDEPVIAIQANVSVVEAAPDGLSVQTTPRTITAIPYYAWANRGKSPMQVWLPSRIKEVKITE